MANMKKMIESAVAIMSAPRGQKLDGIVRGNHAIADCVSFGGIERDERSYSLRHRVGRACLTNENVHHLLLAVAIACKLQLTPPQHGMQVPLTFKAE